MLLCAGTKDLRCSGEFKGGCGKLTTGKLRACLVREIFLGSATVVLSFLCGKLVFNHELIKLKRFISSFTAKLFN